VRSAILCWSALSLGSLAASGCAGLIQPAIVGDLPCRVGKPMVETMLFMGLSSPHGPVSADAFQLFVETDVTPRWKEGYTLLDAQGLWLSEARKVTERESSRVLLRLHDDTLAASADIEASRAAYIKAFAQDAVGRTDLRVCADF